MGARPGRFTAALFTAVLTAGACVGPEPAAAPIGPDDRLYVSIGDSYAAGYQPGPDGTGSTTTNGFAYQLAEGTAGTADPVRLVNFGCSGVTSTALLGDRGCAGSALGPGASGYPSETQAAAAEDFLRRYSSQVVLVTIVVGGNDVLPCLQNGPDGAGPDATPDTCVTDAVTTLRSNLGALLGGVREAAGPSVPVVGLTYPDVLLGAWTSDAPGARTLATDSVPLFRDALNPALQEVYSAAGATFLDITAASGGYDSLADTVADGTYGDIPAPVARVCALSFYCSVGDVHATTEGHRLIADEIRAALGVS